ncbi:NrdH-redoxin [Bacillus canaveralius]|uniref:NrdH-redoxin n=1 Tax=Bacillus canaveralius TaxID=1403243 RepID=A0A2N5GJM1_9BACI|nr:MULTISPECIES: glutaredoxin domain-containing protein [Bacillus]PLR80537.1 NrdH-redoxin [Bacillus sp. V33-4]PLR81400.1 NrdH-redoxin [Bacillus canaveralius]PLR90060.1 NrdH-redoxin [Bacillus canaveralius]RSK53061.1 NrdH-redoxin [Bacillus canaveralius]
MKKIILYSQPECPPCDIVKLFFKEHGVSYQEKNIKSDPVAYQELTGKFQSYSTPTVIINDTVIAGFDLEKLSELLDIPAARQ